MPEEAHHSGSAERQCPAAQLSLARWVGAAGERREDEGVPTPDGECLAWRDLGFGPRLFRYEVLREAEEHWPNEVDKRRIGLRKRGKGTACMDLQTVVAGYGFYTVFLFHFFFAQVACMSDFFFFLLHFEFSSTLIMILVYPR